MTDKTTKKAIVTGVIIFGAVLLIGAVAAEVIHERCAAIDEEPAEVNPKEEEPVTDYSTLYEKYVKNN